MRKLGEGERQCPLVNKLVHKLNALISDVYKISNFRNVNFPLFIQQDTVFPK